jgi:hypothetical protein
VIVAYFFIASVIGIPMTWIIGGACLAGATYIVIWKGPLGSLKVRLGLAATYLLLCGAFWILGKSGVTTRVVLNDSSVSSDFLGRTSSVSRQNLRFTVIRRSPWFNIRPWGSWTSFSGNGKTEKLGPSFAGFDVFWGPHGLIRGDDLGAHMAKWAGVVPIQMPVGG